MTTIRQHIPLWFKRFVRIAVYGVLDTLDNITGRREPMIPPRMKSLVVGAGNFKKIGKDFRDYLIHHARLAPEHRVLEIGSGYGRMAVGLTDFLTPPGSYDGIEIINNAVNWCTKEISTRYPHFRFHHADINNPYSNPEGKGTAAEYHVPFADGTFDLVFLTSVFSHMLPNDIDAYLSEINRTLKPNGCCFITYYLLNDFSQKQIHDRRASVPFYHSFDGYLSTSRRISENSIAVPESKIRELYQRYGLRIDEPILYGAWPGRDHFLTHQDVIVACKINDPTTRISSNSALHKDCHH